MADAFYGEIRIFGFTFPPENWSQCNGQVVLIQQYQALYTILGIQFGGNGQTNFNLPNLQGSAVCQAGTGPGLTPRPFAKSFGVSTVTLTENQIPNHNHALNAIPGTSTAQLVNSPTTTTYLARTFGQNDYTNTDTYDTTLAAEMVGGYGTSGPHENRQPFLPMSFCICMYGEYPVKAT